MCWHIFYSLSLLFLSFHAYFPRRWSIIVRKTLCWESFPRKKCCGNDIFVHLDFYFSVCLAEINLKNCECIYLWREKEAKHTRLTDNYLASFGEKCSETACVCVSASWNLANCQIFKRKAKDCNQIDRVYFTCLHTHTHIHSYEISFACAVCNMHFRMHRL